MWDGLPAPPDREQNAKRQFVACERDDRPASELMDDPQGLRNRLTHLHYRERFGCDDDYVTLDPPVVARWIRTANAPVVPANRGEIYEGLRPIDPGTPQELESALLSDHWTDARLVRMATNLYQQAGERAARWLTARTALDKVLRRTTYHPSGRDRAISEDLEDDLRKLARWLAAFDRWIYVVHVHMAARLPDLALHDALLNRYESVLRFSPLAVDAYEYRGRVAAFLRLLDDRGSPASYRMQRDASREFRASRNDLDVLLKEAAAMHDPRLREWTGDIALDRFLHARAKHDSERLPASQMGEWLLEVWDEVARKARWLHYLNVAALLELQGRIAEQFAAQVGPLPPEEETNVRRRSCWSSRTESAEIDTQPEVVELELEEEPKQTEETSQEDLWWD